VLAPIPKRNKRKSWRRGIIPARDHLYVVTTNLDAQRTAIWDMGKIAVSGDGAIFCSCSFARGGRGHSGGQLRP
jgi:hypothetical protein